MFKAEIKIDEKEYFRCNMFYLRKYLSLREIILVLLLLIGGIMFLIMWDSIIILILGFVTVGLILIAIALFIITAKAGYKQDYKKQNIVAQNLIFDEKLFTVESLNPVGEILYTEKYNYSDIDKIALRKENIYLYPGVATSFYIYPDAVKDCGYGDLRLFLIDRVDKSKFKMKTRVKQFPGYSKSRSKKDNADNWNQNGGNINNNDNKINKNDDTEI